MNKDKRPETLDDSELDTVEGGMLLPAIQQVTRAGSGGTTDILGYAQDAVATESSADATKHVSKVEYPNLKVTFSAAE